MGLHQNMVKERVSQLALREPALCGPDESIRSVIDGMRKQKLGCVIVVDDDRKPVGMFTESMLTRLLVQGSTELDASVKTHMAERLPWVKTSDPIVNVLEAMQARNIRFICVVDDDGRVAGLTGQKGLMEYVADHFPRQVMVQRVGSPPSLNREGA